MAYIFLFFSTLGRYLCFQACIRLLDHNTKNFNFFTQKHKKMKTVQNVPSSFIVLSETSWKTLKLYKTDTKFIICERFKFQFYLVIEWAMPKKKKKCILLKIHLAQVYRNYSITCRKVIGIKSARVEHNVQCNEHKKCILPSLLPKHYKVTEKHYR